MSRLAQKAFNRFETNRKHQLEFGDFGDPTWLIWLIAFEGKANRKSLFCEDLPAPGITVKLKTSAV